VIDVVEGGEKVVKENGEKDKATPLNGAGRKQKGKRKVDEANGDATPQLSKRAAKRAKLKALQDEKATSSAVDTPSEQPPTTEDTPSKSQATANG